jgi:cytochrome c553
MSTTARILLAAAALAGCQSASGDPEPPLQPPSARFEHDMMVRFHMHESYDLLRSIQRLLIRGRLSDATMFARAIAEAPDEPGMTVFAKPVLEVRRAAAALATSPSVDEACRRVAKLAVACADCHVQASVVPEFSAPGKAPPDAPNVTARMTRHLWATDRLWEATLGGGDDPWRAGLDVLAATPLPFAVAPGDRAGLARRLQQAADTARKRTTTTDDTERARIYGEILTVCAACHAGAGSTRP